MTVLRVVLDVCGVTVMILMTYQLCYWFNDLHHSQATKAVLGDILGNIDALSNYKVSDNINVYTRIV